MSPNGLFVAVGGGNTNEYIIGTSTDGSNWQVVANLSRLFICNGIAYGLVNGVGTFVSVGWGTVGGVSNIGTSTDGLNWQVAADVGSLFSGEGAGGGNGIAYGLINGVGTFVAVGYSENGGVDNIGTSTDGLNWKVATNVGSLFSGGNRYGNGIAYGLVNGVGTFVAVGLSENGGVDNIGISTDGSNWQVAASVGSLFNGSYRYGLAYGVAYGLVNGVGTFVAVGYNGNGGVDNIGTSTDGLNWQVAADVGSLFSGGGGGGYGIAYGLVNNVGTFVAVGNSDNGGVDNIGVSTDGLNWQVAANVGSLFSGGVGIGIAYGLVNNVGTFVAVGYSETGGVDHIGTSTDGLNWQVAADVGSLFSGSGYGAGIAYGLVNNVGTFVAVGYSATGGVDNIGISTDGLNWQVAASVGSLFSGEGAGYDIAYGAGTFVAVGYSDNGGVDQIGTSTDGLNWQVAADVGSLFTYFGGSGGGYGIAYGLVNNVGTFVAVGYSDNGGVDQIGTSTDGLNWTVAADVGSLFSGSGGSGIAYGEVTPTPKPTPMPTPKPKEITAPMTCTIKATINLNFN
jgi:hypothetical protein